MKNNLTKGRMDDFFILRMGKTPPRDNSDYWLNGTNNWVAISDMGKSKYISSTSECITDKGVADCNMVPVPANTVVMSFKLSIGKTAITSKPIFTNEAIMSFLPKTEFADNILVDYIYYYLLGHRWGGTGKKAVMGVTLNKASLSATPFSFPSLADQKQAIAELDKINETIEDCRELLRNLDALAQSLFYDFFGDPITNPKGWTLKQIKSFLSLKAGKAIKASELLCHISDGYYPCYGGNGIRGYISRKSHHGLYNIIGRQGALCGNVTLANSDFYATEHAVVVTPLIATSPYWLYYLLTALNLNQYAKGVAQPGLSVGVINEISIPVPPLELQEKFAARIEQIEAQKKVVESTIAELQTLLDSRMDYWFN